MGVKLKIGNKSVFDSSTTMDESNLSHKEVLNNSNVIRNISYDQKEILYNIMNLYNGGKPFDCDMTASSLKFYEVKKSDKYIIPEPKILFDVFPQNERIKKIETFEKLPLKDGSIHSIVVDLPFLICPKTSPSSLIKGKGSNIIFHRFHGFYPVEELFENIYWWINECYRILDNDGILIWKMQSTVSGGRQVWSTPFSFLCADKAGFCVKDEFILEAKNRLISNTKIKKQIHARKFTSTFWVFYKNKKEYTKNSISNIFEMCKQNVYEGKKWEIK